MILQGSLALMSNNNMDGTMLEPFFSKAICSTASTSRQQQQTQGWWSISFWGLEVSIVLGVQLEGKGDEQIELYYTIVSCWQRRMSWARQWWNGNRIGGENVLIQEVFCRRCWRRCADSASAISGQWALGAPLLNGEEIVRRENDVVKANVEFRRSRVADNVSKVFDARIGDANRGDFP